MWQFLFLSSLTPALTLASLEVPDCHPALASGELCQSRINEVRPTQPEVGALEVRIKAEKYEKLGEEALQELLRKKIAPVVLGPEGELYLLDHHHSLLALQTIGVKQAFFRVQQNWTDTASLSAFWRRMREQGYGWMRTEEGQTLSPLSDEFPKKLEDCGNNRMRSVVYLLIQSGALKKGIGLYPEFRLAEALRDRGFRAPEGRVRDTAKEIEEWLKTPAGRQFKTDHSAEGRGELRVSDRL